MRLILNCNNYTIEKIEEINLTNEEFKLLSALISNNYVSYEELKERGLDNVPQYIHRIRMKFPEIDVVYISKNKSNGIRLLNEFKVGG